MPEGWVHLPDDLLFRWFCEFLKCDYDSRRADEVKEFIMGKLEEEE